MARHARSIHALIWLLLAAAPRALLAQIPAPSDVAAPPEDAERRIFAESHRPLVRGITPRTGSGDGHFVIRRHTARVGPQATPPTHLPVSALRMGAPGR